MKQVIIFFIILFAGVLSLEAQQSVFLLTGKVAFEKKVNQHRYLEADTDGEESIWITEQKKVLPRFVTDYYELLFTQEKTVYRLAKENTDNKYLWGSKPTEADVAVQDLKNQTLTIQRDVYENTYLISDSARQVNWRITNETRTIAGFECKKAVGIICDSVYVVAFYADEIPPTSGPEGFGGLPGMILGLAIPRLYTTWFATRVELITPAETQLSPRQKGKKVTYKQLQTELSKGLKDWGKYGARRIWGAML